MAAMADAPGWEAIDAALAGIYGDAKPHHWGTTMPWALGGPDPLDGVSVYARVDPAPHWHYVSYGLTQLYADEEETEPSEQSGWGFELTFRLARDPADAAPPVWAANLLQNLARYVVRSRRWFEAGHHMNIGGPIAAERPDTAIRGLAFIEDPELGAIETVHGRVQFLQLVGLTTDEYEAVQTWSTLAFLEAVAPALPLFVTDIDRESVLVDPALSARVQAGVEADGSSTNVLAVDGATWEIKRRVAVVTLGALPAPFVARLLRARLPFGRDFVVAGHGTAIRFQPADSFSIERQDGRLDVGVPAAGLSCLTDAIRPRAGRVEVDKRLVIEIVPTVVRDGYGNPTGEVIG